MCPPIAKDEEERKVSSDLSFARQNCTDVLVSEIKFVLGGRQKQLNPSSTWIDLFEAVAASSNFVHLFGNARSTRRLEVLYIFMVSVDTRKGECCAASNFGRLKVAVEM